MRSALLGQPPLRRRAQRPAGARGYRLELNSFADLSNDEFRVAYLSGAGVVRGGRNATGGGTATTVSRPCRSSSTEGRRVPSLPSRTKAKSNHLVMMLDYRVNRQTRCPIGRWCT